MDRCCKQINFISKMIAKLCVTNLSFIWGIQQHLAQMISNLFQNKIIDSFCDLFIHRISSNETSFQWRDPMISGRIILEWIVTSAVNDIVDTATRVGCTSGLSSEFNCEMVSS